MYYYPDLIVSNLFYCTCTIRADVSALCACLSCSLAFLLLYVVFLSKYMMMMISSACGCGSGQNLWTDVDHYLSILHLSAVMCCTIVPQWWVTEMCRFHNFSPHPVQLLLFMTHYEHTTKAVTKGVYSVLKHPKLFAFF